MASKKKTSNIWNHFSEEDNKKGKCNYCSETVSFTSGTLGNLSRHLKRKHPTISTAPVERQVPVGVADVDDAQSFQTHLSTVAEQHSSQPTEPKTKRTQPSIKDYTVRPLPPNKKNKIDQQLLLMIAKEYHPLSLVNDEEFKKFVSLLNPSYTLPTRKTLSESLLPQLYMQLKERVKIEISNALAVCVTTDAWTSENNESFVGVTAHYIDPDTSQLRSNLLGCIEYGERHTAVNLHEFLREQFNEWMIQNKVAVIVSDNAANILAAVHLGGWRSISCFAHTLNLIVQTGIECISETLTRVKRIVEYFHRSTTGLNKLKDIQKQMNVPQLKIKQDVSTRWNSTYDMLDRVIKVKDALIATLALVRNDLSLSTEDWTLIESAVPILKIFYEVTSEISTEKTVSLSKVIVYCRLLSGQINQRLSQAEGERDEKVKNLLRSLQEQLYRRFDTIESNMLYAECTILDPRFKGRGFRDENNYKSALSKLKQNIGAMQTPDIPDKPAPSTSTASSSTSTALSSSIWNDFDQEIANLVPENTIAAGIVELDKYIQEPIINRSENPLLWWHVRKPVYPLLYQYILKRLNIVATSVPCERIFSKAGLTLTNRRRRLKAKKLSQLLFISSNQK